ncbi:MULTISPECIES: hypothetical protein [Calothrix]|uniref:Cobalamin adenosyltransferase-like domain-containing protein n=2 Tax=Calothrix TaxID=1186 RepID=A0ABR8A9W5_9CYAN|nr:MULTISPECIES: hypothetical protein [Calothrix]MBD2196599.1 hypothetical protein [Calothrix parietina FACHB-288]MBD2228036.1 hypothetical protein [Calothrix anomala FACHB-343]
MSNKRITANYVAGSGDIGFAQVLHDAPLLLKSSPACTIQGKIETVRNSIESALYLNPDLSPDLNYLLYYLNRNIFSLASFCYLKANTDKHLLPFSLIEWMDKNIKLLQEELGHCPDFLYHNHPTLISLDKLRIDIRELERYFIRWRYSNEVVGFLLLKPDLTNNVNYHSAILNRLSSYMFWAIRKEGRMLKGRGELIEERYWQAVVEEWNPPIN